MVLQGERTAVSCHIMLDDVFKLVLQLLRIITCLLESYPYQQLTGLPVSLLLTIGF